MGFGRPGGWAGHGGGRRLGGRVTSVRHNTNLRLLLLSSEEEEEEGEEEEEEEDEDDDEVSLCFPAFPLPALLAPRFSSLERGGEGEGDRDEVIDDGMVHAAACDALCL